MPESPFEELKRYVRFQEGDGTALRGFAAQAEPHFGRIAEQFYERLSEHEEARGILEGPEQVERLKGLLREWMQLLFSGPWDEVYYDRRARIGRVHVRIGLPQRFMFGAMDVIRIEFVELAQRLVHDAAVRLPLVRALHKILDLELAIMLESYREAFVGEIQAAERLQKADLERQLALSEERYAEIVEQGEALTITCEPGGGILFFNRRSEAITGLLRDRARGRDWFELFCSEEDRARVGDLWARALSGERVVTPCESPVLTPEGRGRCIRWHFTRLPARAGYVLCAIGLDITEERDLASRTQRAERLAAVGTLATGIAHEIRNPLNAAHIQLVVAQRKLSRSSSPETDAVRSALDLAESEMKRLARLVEDVQDFARPHPPRLAPADLRAAAEATLALLSPQATEAGVQIGLAPGEPLSFEFDHEKLKQVLINLIRNGIEATGRGGRVDVRVESGPDRARLAVQDDGPGLPPDTPLFEPFFTTKERGTGLGLAIVHRIVEDHRGTIEVDSRPGRTVFSVSLPLAPSTGV